MERKKTVFVTGASRGIGAALARAFLGRGYNVVANSLNLIDDEFEPAQNLAPVKGDIGKEATSRKIAETAILMASE